MAAKKAPKRAKTSAKPAPADGASDGNGSTNASHSTSSKKMAWNLRLYVAGDSPRSRTALANLKKLCEATLKDNYNIEVIDLTQRPDLAKADQILAVPTLIRNVPEPMKRIIGDLSNADRALVALDMQPS